MTLRYQQLYRDFACPDGCDGGSRFLGAMVTDLGFHILIYDVHHDNRTYGQIAGRGWSLDEARADGRARLAEWLGRQRHWVEVAA